MVCELFSGDCWHWCANFQQAFRHCGYREYDQVSELVVGITVLGIRAGSSVTVVVVVVVFRSRCAGAIDRCAELVAAQEDGDAPVTGADFAKLSSALAAMENKVLNLKCELAEEQEAAHERLAKRMKLDRAPMFKKKAHEKQYYFNGTVKDKMQEAHTALSQLTPALEKAKSALHEGEKLIEERQKQIRIADRSEYGWATVEEYMDDELAENSDDEKRMFKAELRAGRKRKAAEAAKNKARKGTSAKPAFVRYSAVRGDGLPISSQSYSPLVQSAQPLYGVCFS